MEMKYKFLFTYNQPPNRILIPVKVRDRLEGEIKIDVEDGDMFADMNVVVHNKPYITIDDGYNLMKFGIAMPMWYATHITKENK